MKANLRKRHSVYGQLKLKLLIRFALAGIGAIILLFCTYNFLWYQRGANFLVDMIQRLWKLSYEEALHIYQQVIRNNTEIIWAFSVLILFILLLTLVLNWFVCYFNMINQGVQALLDEDAEIHFPSEMAETERTLVEIKSELRQRRLESQLAVQRKNDLVMYLAHDIRTPLTSVIGYLSLMDEVPDMPTEQRAKYVHITLEKAYRLERMINEFFEITRYNLQQISISKEPLDLYYMLVQVIDELHPILSANGNTTVLKVPEDTQIYGDPDKLARVFNNILKNAAAYSFSNTEIVIQSEISGEFLHIFFQNQGKHIPQEKLSTLFEKFFRLDESRTSNTGGSGLGLAIAKEIISLHDGTITASCVDNTITFAIQLPYSL